MRTGALLLASTLLALPAAAHDVYGRWQRPTGGSCCSNQDCRPVQACRADDGGIGALVDGRCFGLPEQARVPAPVEVWENSPESLHACFRSAYVNGQLVGIIVFCWDFAAST